MLERPLGRTGRQVTSVGYGAWAIGGLGYGDQDERQAFEAIDAYLAGGGRFMDTARGYGVSEILIGQRLRAFPRADEVFVASKSGSTHPPIVRTDLETSRFCLRRDALDLYYIHVPPRDPDGLRRLLDVYQALKDAGRARLVGVSCPRIETPDDVDLVRRAIQDGRADVLQMAYSMAETEAGPLIAEAAGRGIAVVARMNLLGGLLTGKYKPGHVFADRANDWRASIPQDRLDEVLRIVGELAARFVRPPYETLGQVALGFALAAPGVSAIIPGGRSAAQVRANLSIDGLPPLAPAFAKDLAAAAAPIRAILAEARRAARKEKPAR
jgi:aryl-alcohol dehydrogenase-like predicted oxidoreductase